MLIKQKSLSLSRNLALGTFHELLLVLSTKINLLINGLEVLYSASDKAKLFAKNFSKDSDLDDSDISLSIFPSRTNLKLHNISVLARWSKRS